MKHKPVAWLATNAVGHRYLRFKKPDETHNPVPLYALEDEPPCKTGSQCVGGKCQRCAAQEAVACIVKGCSNREDQGRFVGELCAPCHTFITTGEGRYSQVYRNAQREWQGLTDEDLSVCDEDGVILARYWEAKLWEKNK